VTTCRSSWPPVGVRTDRRLASCGRERQALCLERPVVSMASLLPRLTTEFAEPWGKWSACDPSGLRAGGAGAVVGSLSAAGTGGAVRLDRRSQGLGSDERMGLIPVVCKAAYVV